jgi:hypothetical protein
MGDSQKVQLQENQTSERTDGIPGLVASGKPPPGAPPVDGHHVTQRGALLIAPPSESNQ